MSRPDTLTWLASHELRLGWRDWVAMMTAGRRSRARTVTIALIVFAAFMHLLAWSMVGRYADAVPDKTTLVVVTGTILLSWALLLSQAMESVTRAFYTRSDLDLILTSPVSPTQSVFGAHRPHRRLRRHGRDFAGDAFHRRAGASKAVSAGCRHSAWSPPWARWRRPLPSR